MDYLQNSEEIKTDAPETSTSDRIDLIGRVNLLEKEVAKLRSAVMFLHHGTGLPPSLEE